MCPGIDPRPSVTQITEAFMLDVYDVITFIIMLGLIPLLLVIMTKILAFAFPEVATGN